MTPRRAIVALTLTSMTACLPDNPGTATETATNGEPSTSEPTGTVGQEEGLFACESPPCTLVLVSQTLDDRIDVFDVTTATPWLRGRIGLDLKPDPSGQQISGNLLDESYDLLLTSTDLIVTVGHYPDTDQGSLLRFPRSAFADLPAGGTFATDQYFSSGSFTAGVEALAHGRREGIFLLPHPSGRLLVGVFANSLQTTEWTTPSEILVVDPANITAAPGSVDLGALDKPCIGGWRLEALDAAVSKVAVACDGSESVAVLTLPADFATADLSSAAAGITGCGLNLGGTWSTQFVAADGGGGFLAVQSKLDGAPRLWHVRGDCSPSGIPTEEVSPGLEQVRLLRQSVLLRPVGAEAALWLVASGPTDPGVVIVRGGSSPAMCGKVSGLDLLDGSNVPWALAINDDRLAIGAGPPSNPELAEGKGQVLWATLDRTKQDTCEISATGVVDLNAGRYNSGEPETWVRAPNVLVIAELDGGP